MHNLLHRLRPATQFWLRTLGGVRLFKGNEILFLVGDKPVVIGGSGYRALTRAELLGRRCSADVALWRPKVPCWNLEVGWLLFLRALRRADLWKKSSWNHVWRDPRSQEGTNFQWWVAKSMIVLCLSTMASWMLLEVLPMSSCYWIFILQGSNQILASVRKIPGETGKKTKLWWPCNSGTFV